MTWDIHSMLSSFQTSFQIIIDYKSNQVRNSFHKLELTFKWINEMQYLENLIKNLIKTLYVYFLILWLD